MFTNQDKKESLTLEKKSLLQIAQIKRDYLKSLGKRILVKSQMKMKIDEIHFSFFCEER